jgi:hypothetical protein
MHDIPKVDDPLLRAILEMREYVDELIDQEKRHVGEWADENARDADLAATAEVGGQRRGGTSAHAAARGETRADGGDRAVRPAPVDPRAFVAPPAADRRSPGHDADADDPRKRLDALARRLDGRIGRPQGPAADGS